MQGKSDPHPELLDAAALCGHLVPAGSVHAFLAEHRQRLFPDEMFADLFPSGRGRPSVPADVIATVMVLQSLEGFSDRDAVEQLRMNIAWKVAAGRPLDDPGFHSTVLTLWRNKLRTSEKPERIFDAVRAVIAETGVLKGKTRRALDSTVLDDAVATQDTVTQLIAAIRRVRRLIPEAAALELTGHDYSQPGKPRIAWDDPEARDELVSALVNDARTVLAGVEGLELTGEAADAAGLLALVAGQDVEPGNQEGLWRIARKTAPDRVISTVDPESRHIHKTVGAYRNGYKAHIVVEPRTGLICGQRLTPGNTPDGAVGVSLLANEPKGRQILADAAYGSGETRAALRRHRHRLAIKPWPMADTGRFSRDDFTIDHVARTATCPAGHTAPIGDRGFVAFRWRCQGCPLRVQCTTAKDGRKLEISVHDAELAEGRRAWRDGDFVTDYRRWRPMVERSLAWLVRPGRRVAYRGTARNRIWLAHRAAAVNLQRLINLGLTHNGTWLIAT
ncbi:MAG TPA: IS1182 family transposase [Acidimicrobiia bacterium]|nr:IS1182 family transposase [Acidimicrobiia bacterium]